YGGATTGRVEADAGQGHRATGGGRDGEGVIGSGGDGAGLVVGGVGGHGRRTQDRRGIGRGDRRVIDGHVRPRVGLGDVLGGDVGVDRGRHAVARVEVVLGDDGSVGGKGG